MIIKTIREMDNPENKSDVNPPKKYIAMPYIKTASERVGRILKKFDIVLSNKSSNTIHSAVSVGAKVNL